MATFLFLTFNFNLYLHSAPNNEPVNPGLDANNPYILDQRANPSIENKISEWSLDEIEEFAVSNNPIYLAEKQNIDMARGDVITASLYRNPVFNYQQQFIPFSGVSSGGPFGSVLGTANNSGGPIEYAPSITQDVDVSGVIEKKTQVALKGFQASIANFEDFDRLFRLRLRQNYWLYLYVTELNDFQKEFYDNYIDLVKLTKFRAEKGDISPLEYDRILLEKVRIEKDFRDTEIYRTNVAKELRYLIGISPQNNNLSFKGKLKYFPSEKLGINLKTFDIENRPDLKYFQLKASQSKLNVDLKRKEGGIAYLNLGGEVRKKGNETYTGVFATIPLKIFDRGQGEILKAEENYKKSVLELESKRKQIYAEIRASIKELNAREELLQTYDDIKLISKNKDVQEKYRLAYVRGATNLVTFLEAERNYLNVLRSYYEQLYLYYNAIESFRAAIGKLGTVNE
ncbi:MAG: TolC family protein [Leptospiraceae bacterium]|nr:TolC family protein [Leptospiraceae bacterium]